MQKKKLQIQEKGCAAPRPPPPPSKSALAYSNTKIVYNAVKTSINASKILVSLKIVKNSFQLIIFEASFLRRTDFY